MPPFVYRCPHCEIALEPYGCDFRCPSCGAINPKRTRPHKRRNWTGTLMLEDLENWDAEEEQRRLTSKLSRRSRKS